MRTGGLKGFLFNIVRIVRTMHSSCTCCVYGTLVIIIIIILFLFEVCVLALLLDWFAEFAEPEVILLFLGRLGEEQSLEKSPSLLQL